MKFFVVFCSFFFICQAWALGSRPGINPASTNAMGDSAGALNQVTHEQEFDQATLEEQEERDEEQRMKEVEGQQNSPEEQQEIQEEIEQNRYDVVPKH